MNNKIITNRLLIAVPLTLLLLSFLPLQKKTKVYLIGDSTMADKEVKAYPETGWGMPFAYFFDSTITVDNRAKNGRSTSSFIAEGLWQPVVNNLKEGDYVFIQFGHNDEVPTKKTYTTEADFEKYLQKYVDETRSKKAIPVLISPVARRKFNDGGKIEETHEVYSKLVKKIAEKYNVPFIDLDHLSQALLQQFGAENSKWLYMQLEEGEHPNYPEGRNDNTHFSEFGARKMAEIVLKQIKELKLDLADHIRPPLSGKK